MAGRLYDEDRVDAAMTQAVPRRKRVGVGSASPADRQGAPVTSKRVASGARQLPLHHIAIRVPWHDTGWGGRVCAAPQLNGSCLKLKRAAEDRRGGIRPWQGIRDLPRAKWPSFIAERGGVR